MREKVNNFDKNVNTQKIEISVQTMCKNLMQEKNCLLGKEKQVILSHQ